MPDRGPCVQTVPQDNDRPLKWLKLQEFTYIDKSILCFLTEHAWPHLFRRFTLDSTNWVLKLQWGPSSELAFFLLESAGDGGYYYCSALNYSKHPSIFKGLLEFTYWQVRNSMGKHYTTNFVVLPNLFKQKFCF